MASVEQRLHSGSGNSRQKGKNKRTKRGLPVGRGLTRILPPSAHVEAYSWGRKLTLSTIILSSTVMISANESVSRVIRSMAAGFYFAAPLASDKFKRK